MKRHINIPIFVPHLGCPNTCVFCNQRKISGCEKADFFFGGSFTGIERADMIYLLETAKKFIDAGKVGSIRLSTRPDYIDEEILDILARYGVKTIELGIQSMSDEVLLKSGRGHNSAQTEKACALITSRGFELIGQMMTGLPGATEETELYTAKKICSMGACGARIYPTVVFRDTELCRMMERGDYSSPDMETVISEGAKVLAGLEGVKERLQKRLRRGKASRIFDRNQYKWICVRNGG